MRSGVWVRFRVRFPRIRVIIWRRGTTRAKSGRDSYHARKSVQAATSLTVQSCSVHRVPTCNKVRVVSGERHMLTNKGCMGVEFVLSAEGAEDLRA